MSSIGTIQMTAGTNPAFASWRLQPEARSWSHRRSQVCQVQCAPINQPLRGRNEIVECNLSVSPFGCLMPRDTEFRTSTNVRQRKHAASLHQEGNEDAELWCHRNAVAAIRGHDRRV